MTSNDTPVIRGGTALVLQSRQTYNADKLCRGSVAVYAGAGAALASSWIAYYPYPLRLRQGGREERCLSRLPM